MREEKRIYKRMWHHFGQVMKTGHYQTDALIDNANDHRRGVTALSYLHNNTSLTDEISGFLQTIELSEPEQYYQPVSDLHLTVLSIVTCFDHFQLSDSEGQDYAEVFKEAVKGCGTFDIQFRGITASPGCILLQGFMPDEQLSDLRNKLRVAFDHSHLHTSRDARYKIVTAHSTIVRFKQPLRDPDRLYKLLKDYREFDFGLHTVDKLELVFHDWYLKKAHTRHLAEIHLAT